MWHSWRRVDWLVWWFGVFQLGHSLLNDRYLLLGGNPPFPGPPEGWNGQGKAFLDGFATVDMLLALGSVAFALAWSRGRRAVRVGVALTAAAVYAATVFTFGVVQAGAWRLETTGPYVATWVPFLPVVLLGIELVGGRATGDR